MLTQHLFESSPTTQGQATLKQLQSIASSGQNSDLKIGVEMMPLQAWQAKYLIGVYKGVAQKYGAEKALSLFGNYDFVEHALARQDARLDQMTRASSVPGDRGVAETVNPVSGQGAVAPHGPAPTTPKKKVNPISPAARVDIQQRRPDSETYTPEKSKKPGVAEGDYDIRRDPTYQKYNPETHVIMYKDGKHKLVKHDQVANARSQGWKVRSSLKAFAKGQSGVAEAKADPTSTWVVYDGDKVKRFKTHQGAKAYAEQHGGKVASSAHYADKIQGKQGVAEAFIAPALSAANANAEHRRQGAAGGGYRGRIDIPVQSREDYISAGRALKKAAAAAGQKIEYGLSNGVMSVFSDSMDSDALDQFIDSVLGQGVAEGSIYKKDQDLSSIPTQELEAFVRKHWGGGVPTYGQGESVKRAMRELRRRQKQGVAEQQVNEISPYDFDSDEDYYNALRAQKRRAQGRSADDYDDYEDEDHDDGDDESYYEKYVRTKGLEEGRMGEIDAEYQDYKNLSPREFFNIYKITKQQWVEKYKGLLQQDSKPIEEEGVRIAAPIGSRALGNGNMGQLIKAYHNYSPRLTLMFGDRSVDIDKEDIEEIAKYYDNKLDVEGRKDFVYNIMSRPDRFEAMLQKIGRRKTVSAQQPGLFQEADKKKDDVKDVALQRAISKSRAAFPSAASGFEALAKQFIKNQEDDQRNFDKVKDANRRQDQLLSQISQIDKDQENEIDDLGDQAMSLSQRLQQLQSVNSKLEKTLAAMSGRKTKTSKVEPISISTPEPVSKAAPAAAEPSKVSKASATVAAPQTSVAPSSVKYNVKLDKKPEVDPGIINLATGPSEPAAAEVPASDNNVVWGAFGSRVPKADQGPEPEAVPAGQGSFDLGTDDEEETPVVPGPGSYRKFGENKKTNDTPEVDYDDPRWDAMVKRVGQKAKEGPRKTVWDPVKRVYKTVPVKPVKEQEPSRAGYNAIKSVSDWAEKLRAVKELQKDIKLMADPEAKAAVQQRMGELLKLGIEKGYTK